MTPGAGNEDEDGGGGTDGDHKDDEGAEAVENPDGVASQFDIQLFIREDRAKHQGTDASSKMTTLQTLYQERLDPACALPAEGHCQGKEEENAHQDAGSW
jgi:hypothetical protein